MAIKLKYRKLELAVLILLALFILMLSYVLSVSKDKLREEALLNKQSLIISLQEDSIRPKVSIILNTLGSGDAELVKALPSKIICGIPRVAKDKNKSFGEHQLAYSIILEDKDFLTEIDNLDTKMFDLVYTNYDEHFTSDLQAETFLKAIQSKNLIYFSGLIDKQAMVYKIANKINYDIIRNDIILDAEISDENISKQLQNLEIIAIERGYAVALGNAYPKTIEHLQKWSDNIKVKGIELVNFSELYSNLYEKK